MSKAFQITAKADNGRARIDIIGNIYEWSANSAETFREKVADLVNNGITDAHVYINSGGGDVFQANEIENIMRAFKGTVTGEGGALVASAATYLAISIKGFKLAENSQFMIHKPATYAGGTEKEIENKLQLLKNITEQYKNAYLKVTTMSKADFLEKWEGGDWWLTAQQAKDYGFVSDIISSVEIDETTAKMIAACGGNTNFKNHNIKNDMDLSAMATSLGLPPTATENQINEALAAMKLKAAKADRLENDIREKEKALRAKEIKDTLDAAENEKRITADTRPAWEEALNANFDNAKTLLQGLAPTAKLSDGIEKTAVTTATTYKGKNFEQLQDEDPGLLAQIENENPELFASMFADWKKRMKVE